MALALWLLLLPGLGLVRGGAGGGELEPRDPLVWVCAPCLRGRPPHPCPQPPQLGQGRLKFRVSLPGGFPFVSPPAHRGSWGRQGEIYPGKRNIPLSPREWSGAQPGSAPHPRTGLGVGRAACLRLGKTCALGVGVLGLLGLGGPRSPAGGEDAQVGWVRVGRAGPLPGVPAPLLTGTGPLGLSRGTSGCASGRLGSQEQVRHFPGLLSLVPGGELPNSLRGGAEPHKGVGLVPRSPHQRCWPSGPCGSPTAQDLPPPLSRPQPECHSGGRTLAPWRLMAP